MRWKVVASALAAASGAMAAAAAGVVPGAICDAAAAPAPSAPSALQREGAAALLAGRLAEAEALYQRALAEPVPAASIWFDLCLVRYAAGDHGRAINACYRALDAGEYRVGRLLEQIAAAMSAAGLSTSGLVLPEPARVVRSRAVAAGRARHPRARRRRGHARCGRRSGPRAERARRDRRGPAGSTAS